MTIDLWNNQWQNPIDAVQQGYHIINDYGRLLYIVPKDGTNDYLDTRTIYNDYLDTRTIYERWEPNIFDLNNPKLTIRPDDPYLLGGQFAEWNDSYRHISIADIYDRVSAAMPTMGEKLWSGTTSTRTYERFQEIAHVLGDGPGTHLPHNPPKLALQLPATASAQTLCSAPFSSSWPNTLIPPWFYLRAFDGRKHGSFVPESSFYSERYCPPESSII